MKRVRQRIKSLWKESPERITLFQKGFLFGGSFALAAYGKAKSSFAPTGR